MNKMMILFVSFILMVTSGCTSGNGIARKNYGIENPSAYKVLQSKPDADIFMYKGTVYCSGIDWVNELNLTKDVQITKISQNNKDGLHFEDGTANHLSIGTRIYSVKERGDILIAETEKGDVRYYHLVEG
ncbi:copper resistance protein NlpE [Paenibacillus donghaensis]|uniref:hypothetical protein n=1 Tax=Paenibacillus donghaensis TaxID=414771 RepID=UPI0018845FA6|nr:hypothetical protein [Paenibacillus donghaensis]MBE9918245.1 copper resistance protein NlpE [Paenibacillus donghaensis]